MSDSPTVALSFDDGPDPVWTPRVLEALADRGATATFFVDARRCLRFPDQVEAILAGGHEVGFHCWEHLRHSERTDAEVAADARRGLATLAALGIEPRAWRTPWGIETAASRRVAGEHGLRLWGWNRDSHDWRGDSCAEMLEGIDREGGLKGEPLLLMHDAVGPGAQRQGCAETVRLTTELLRRAEAAELRTVAISERSVPAPRVAAPYIGAPR